MIWNNSFHSVGYVGYSVEIIPHAKHNTLYYSRVHDTLPNTVQQSGILCRIMCGKLFVGDNKRHRGRGSPWHRVCNMKQAEA
jgi:hypothetical protein